MRQSALRLAHSMSRNDRPRVLSIRFRWLKDVPPHHTHRGWWEGLMFSLMPHDAPRGPGLPGGVRRRVASSDVAPWPRANLNRETRPVDARSGMSWPNLSAQVGREAANWFGSRFLAGRTREGRGADLKSVNDHDHRVSTRVDLTVRGVNRRGRR